MKNKSYKLKFEPPAGANLLLETYQVSVSCLIVEFEYLNDATRGVMCWFLVAGKAIVLK